MKKILTIMIVLLSLLTVNNTIAFASENPPEIVADTGILIDAKTGVILYDKGKDTQKEPASTTKMITGLLAIEKLPLDKVVTIDAETPFTEGSRVYLLEGERITVEDLLYALFLESANDAAVALAIEMAGSVENFAVMMNAKAKELGALNTNFINPNGLHLEGHVTTAYDLSVIAKAAMENETFRKYVSTYQHTVEATNKQETRYFYNTNRLLYDTKTNVSANGVIRKAKYDGAIGIKTGYTGQAGGCLVSGASRDGTELIAVVLKSTDAGRFGDSIALLDWGFENYKTVKTIEAGTALGTIKVTKGEEKEVALEAKTDGFATLPIDTSSDVLNKVLKLEGTVEAPVEAGQKVGTVDYFQDNVLMSSVDVITTDAVEKGGLLSVFGTSYEKVNNSYFAIVSFCTLSSAAIAFLLTIRYKNIQRRKKRRTERAIKIAMEREMDKLYYNKDKYMNR
jgi:D-alanyl-D-alanine carboxypeptidase (penicillin-binding protein 5/6)